MEKERHLGEAQLKDTPKKRLNLKIRDGSITLDKLDPALRNSIGDGNYMQAITSDEIDDLWEHKDTPVVPPEEEDKEEDKEEEEGNTEETEEKENTEEE